MNGYIYRRAVIYVFLYSNKLGLQYYYYDALTYNTVIIISTRSINYVAHNSESYKKSNNKNVSRLYNNASEKKKTSLKKYDYIKKQYRYMCHRMNILISKLYSIANCYSTAIFYCNNSLKQQNINVINYYQICNSDIRIVSPFSFLCGNITPIQSHLYSVMHHDMMHIDELQIIRGLAT